MDIQEYLRDVTPLNVLDLFDPAVLSNILNGYSYALESGITLVYPTDQPVTLDTLGRMDALGADAQRTYRRICACWRATEGCGQEQLCINADKHEAMRYLNGDWSDLRLYRCRPLGLWDMSYPLRIDSQIVGVLFSGQFIVAGGEVDWHEALQEYDKNVDWNTCPDRDDHIQAVKTEITRRDMSEECTHTLFDVLEVEETRALHTVTVDDFKKRIQDFEKFGIMNQGLIDELHKPQKEAAEQQYLRSYDDGLASIDFKDETQWWAECGQLVGRTVDLPEIEAVCVYARYRSRYFRRIPQPGAREVPIRLTARDVVPALPVGQLVAVSREDSSGLFLSLGQGQDNIWGYRSQTGDVPEIFSTVVLFRGAISAENQSFLTKLCGVLCTAIDFAQLIFRLRAADQEFRHQVNLIGHSFRTPLQALQFVLEELEEAHPIPTLPDLRKKTGEGMARIRDAREDLRLLLDSTTEDVDTFDLIQILEHTKESMALIAKNHPCVIVKQNEWPRNAFVHANRYRVQRALTCLLDNAVKYSYHGQRRDGGGLYEARVKVTLEANHVRISFTNYGIGFPKHKLDAIREYGIRGDVVDDKKTRVGTGLGLPYAIDVLEDAGGWVHIRSFPAKSATKKERKKHHRYITIVEATLPISRRN